MSVTAPRQASEATDARENPRTSEVLDGRYRVLGLIGAGGMGEVYEGEHLYIGRRVAIKFLRRSLVARKNVLDQFRFEARAAGRLDSDNVASVLDFGAAQDGTLYLVMERLRGETLAQRLGRDRVLTPTDAALMVAQACRGAQSAHDVDVVHCDLKPSNLFLVRRDDDSEQVKLLDFGVARLSAQAKDLRSAGTCRNAGTPRYMSPEQAAASPGLDARTDVYALGVILYQTLTGRFPHSGRDPMAIRCHVLREDPVPIRAIAPAVPQELSAIVHRALARDVTARYQSAREMANELQAFARQPRTATDAPVRFHGTLLETLPDPSSLCEFDVGSSTVSSSARQHALSFELATVRASRRVANGGGTGGHRAAISVIAGAGLIVLLFGWWGAGALQQKKSGASVVSNSCGLASTISRESPIGNAFAMPREPQIGNASMSTTTAAASTRAESHQATTRTGRSTAGTIVRARTPASAASSASQPYTKIVQPRLTLDRDNPYGHVR